MELRFDNLNEVVVLLQVIESHADAYCRSSATGTELKKLRDQANVLALLRQRLEKKQFTGE
jgi:hypothetical protein